MPAVLEDPAVEGLEPLRLLHRLEGARRGAWTVGAGRALQGEDGGAGEELEGDLAAHRVAGQADERHAPHRAHRERPSGAHRHPPEVERAHLLDDVADVVVVADADPGGADDQVAAGALLEVAAEVDDGVAGDAEPHRVAAGLADRGGDGDGVAVDDLSRARLAVGLDELVAGAEHRDPRAAAHLEPHLAEGGAGGEVTGPKPVAGGEDPVPGAHVLAGERAASGRPAFTDTGGDLLALVDLLRRP